MNNSCPEWLPDWRDASRYDLQKAAQNHLRWEFLRRNAEYQRDCEALPGKALKQKWNITTAALQPYQEYHREHDKDGSYIDFPDIASESFPHYYFSFSEAYGAVADHLSSGGEKFDRWLESDLAVMVVDVSAPIREQMQALERILVDRQKTTYGRKIRKGHNVDESLYVFYLRVFDGFTAGATASEIAKVLIPEELENDYDAALNRITHAKKRAEGMVNGGYKDITKGRPEYLVSIGSGT